MSIFEIKRMKYRPFVWIYWRSFLLFLYFIMHCCHSSETNSTFQCFVHIIKWHCNANEGLWMALEAILMDRHQNKCTLYTGLLECQRLLPFILLDFFSEQAFRYFRFQNLTIEFSEAKRFVFVFLRLQFKTILEWISFSKTPFFCVCKHQISNIKSHLNYSNFVKPTDMSHITKSWLHAAWGKRLRITGSLSFFFHFLRGIQCNVRKIKFTPLVSISFLFYSFEFWWPRSWGYLKIVLPDFSSSVNFFF